MKLLLLIALLTSSLAAQSRWHTLPIYAAPFVGTVLDAESSQNFQAHGCRETDPLYGQPPNRGRMYGIGLPVAVAIDLLAWKFRKHRGWWAAPLGYGSMRAYAGIRNRVIGCQ